MVILLLVLMLILFDFKVYLCLRICSLTFVDDYYMVGFVLFIGLTYGGFCFGVLEFMCRFTREFVYFGVLVLFTCLNCLIVLGFVVCIYDG